MRAFILKTGALLMLLSSIAFAIKAALDNAWYVLATPLYLAIGASFWKAGARREKAQP